MRRFSTFFLLLLFGIGIEASNIQISNTHCNYQPNLALIPYGKNIHVGWQMTSSVNGEYQTAYQILVCNRVTNDTVFNSNKILSSESQNIPLPILKSNHFGYYWRVRVWDSNDNVSNWSSPQSFRMMLEKIDAQWIGAITKEEAKLPEGRFSNEVFKKDYFKKAWKDVDSLSSKSIILQRNFKVKKEVVDAVVYICGLGHYQLDINGVKIGDSEFAPLWSEYSKTVYYNVFDVTKYIRKQENNISVLLGNGMFNVQRGTRYSKLQMSFGAPKLLFRMEVSYSDGTVQIIKSNESWKYSLSPITFNSIYGGESYDATLESRMPLMKVKHVEAPEGNLVPQTAPAVKIMERYPLKEWKHLSPEMLAQAAKDMKRDSISPTIIVADMGQNLAGFPEISVSGKRGQKILMYVSERLFDSGVVNQNHTGRGHYYEYTLRGEHDTWHPHFSYYGFRYIQIEGAVMQGEPNPDNLPVIYSLNSCFVYNSAPEISSFQCSNKLFMDTHNLIERAQRSNMQAVFTDCPHREKLGWLEQNHLNGPSLFFNYDLSTFIPKIIRDITDSQKSNGMVPTTAPQYVSFGNLFDDSPEWGSALVILPFMYYDQYGDSTLIIDNYDHMKRYVAYLSSRANGNILDFGLGDWYDYGKHKAGFSKNTPIALVATAHYIFDLQLMKRAARIAGKTVDEDYFSLLCQNVTDSFNVKFYHADSCYYGSGSQCSNALPLFLDICGENKNTILNTLIKDIEKHGNRLTTGDVGNRYLIQALSHSGNDELVYKMFNHYEAPGYGSQLKFGATTLTEQWDPRFGTSWNHFMMGQIDEWLFASLGGIKQKENTYGMRHLIIKPHLPGDLVNVKVSTQTLYGKISVDASKDVVDVVIPIGCDAEVFTPSGIIKKVTSGRWKIM